MSCSVETLAALVVGALEPDEVDGARAHVAACPGCSRELEALEALEGGLRGLRRAPRPPRLAIAAAWLGAAPLLAELLRFLVAEKRAWLGPLLALLLLLSVFAVLADGSAFAPFSYLVYSNF